MSSVWSQDGDYWWAEDGLELSHSLTIEPVPSLDQASTAILMRCNNPLHATGLLYMSLAITRLACEPLQTFLSMALMSQPVACMARLALTLEPFMSSLGHVTPLDSSLFQREIRAQAYLRFRLSWYARELGPYHACYFQEESLSVTRRIDCIMDRCWRMCSLCALTGPPGHPAHP